MSNTNSDLIRYSIFVIIAGAMVIFSWFGLDYFEQNLKPRDYAGNLKSGTILPQPKPLLSFQLIDQDGKPVTPDSFRGHWTFFAIGYTSCPDICPTLMATFKTADRIITATGTKTIPEFLFISVDPERDSPQKVGSYARYFNPRFLGATGSNDEALHALTGQLGLFYRRVENVKSSVSYLIDHSASIMLIDPAAELIAIFSSPQEPKLIAEDFSTIVASYQPSAAKN